MDDILKIIENKVFIIAELSANHGGKLENALKAVEAAKAAGADAIKLQTYTADTMTLDCDNHYFKNILKGTLWEGKKYFDLFREAYTPWEWHESIFNLAKEEGILCFSTPFDKKAVDFLEKFQPPLYKISSFEITDIPLIKYVASKRKPMIISTGIAEEKDIELALKCCREAGNHDLILLKCTSAYPAPFEEANLAFIPEFKKRYNVIPGLSDHTLGIVLPVVAATLGARVIEKHFIPEKSMGGHDASFSLDAKEFKSMVKAVRTAEISIGTTEVLLSKKSEENRKFARSLFVVEDIKAGDRISERNIKAIRPAYGLSPEYYEDVLGKKVKTDLKKGTPFKLDYLEDHENR